MEKIKVQKLENEDDLELLSEKDIVHAEAFGYIMYEGRKNGELHFVKRESLNSILSLRVKKENIIIDESGELYFGRPSCIHINEIIHSGIYSVKDKMLEEVGL